MDLFDSKRQERLEAARKAALLQRGMKEEDVRRIIGENFADYLKMMLPAK